MMSFTLRMILSIFVLLGPNQRALAKDLTFVIDKDGHTLSKPTFIEVYRAPRGLDRLAAQTAFQRTTVTIDNQSSKSQKRLLWTFFPLMEVSLDKVSTTEPLQRTGLLRPNPKLQHLNHPVFPLDIPVGTSTYLVDTMYHNFPFPLAWQLSTQNDYANHMKFVETGVKVFLAAFGVVWIFSFFFFLFLRQKAFIFYSLGKIGLSATLLGLIGFPIDTRSFIATNSLGSLPIIAGLTFAFYWLSNINLLKTSEVLQAKFTKFSEWQIFSCLLVGILGTMFFGAMVEIILLFCLLQVIALTGATLYFRKHTNRKYWNFYLPFNIPNVCGVGAIQLMYLEIIPFNHNVMLYALLVIVLVTMATSILLGLVAKEEGESRAMIESSIRLGIDVQNLLLPKKLTGNHFQLEYHFYYKPFQSQMSGDWLQQWVTKDGTVHFLLGDVTGKGPQAALTVGMITAIADYCIQNDLPAKDCLLEINSCLYEMFDSKIVTTCSGASITLDGTSHLYNSGGLGWYHASQQNTKHILTRGPLVGLKPNLSLKPTTLVMKSGDILMTLSDGLGDGPRSLKKIGQNLNTLTRQPQDLNKIVDSLCQHSKNHHDDQALVAIRSLNQVPSKLYSAA